MKSAWQDAWFRNGIGRKDSALWRGVEAQHMVATMRLVDDLAEQEVLERLLEVSKPPQPAKTHGMHFLLFTPFRYRSPHASRFRIPVDPGIWYGAEEIRTACAEVAFWKWRFLMDSAGLASGALHTEHTLFEAAVAGSCADLTTKPWSGSSATWRHASDYSGCQAFAREARSRQVGWIRYGSVRWARGYCGAVLDPMCLTMPEPMRQQTWACKSTAAGSYMRHASSGEGIDFPATLWG